MRHLNPSLIISLIALIVALGGTSYAVTKLPRNSVGNPQIKNNAVTSEKVRNGSLLSEDFRSGELPRGATGATGATGLSQSISASNISVGTSLVSKGFPETVLDTTDDGSGPIVIEEDSKLVVNAAVDLYKGISSPDAVADAKCSLFLFPSGSVGFTISPSMRTTLGLTEAAVGGIGPASAATISLVGAVNVSPGSYDVSVMCQRTNTSGDSDATAVPVYDSGSLTAIQIGR